MKKTLLSLYSLFFFLAVNAQAPRLHEVGADVMPDFIAPAVTPFGEMNFSKPVFPSAETSILNYGAQSGTKATEAIQKAIDDLHSKGGGKVIVPAGKWMTGRISLKSNINLHLEKGAELHFSGEIEDYLPVVFTRNEGIELYSLGACIYANEAENIALTGKGTIYGPSVECEVYRKRLDGVVIEQFISADTPVEERIFDGKNGVPVFLPMTVAPINSKNILIEGISIKDPIFWNLVPQYCDNIIIRGVKVESTLGRTDGIDIESSTNALIEYTTLECGDDCFTIKSGRAEDGIRVNRPSENIVIRHCLALKGPGGVVFGSETAGKIRNVYVHDCVFVQPNRGFYFKTRRNRGGGGENLHFERIRLLNTKFAFHFDMLGQPMYVGELAKRFPVLDMTPLTPFYRDMSFKDIVVENCQEVIKVTGIPESKLTNVTIENMTVDNSSVLFRFQDVKDVKITDSNIKCSSNLMSVSGVDNLTIENSVFDVPGGRIIPVYLEGEDPLKNSIIINEKVSEEKVEQDCKKCKVKYSSPKNKKSSIYKNGSLKKR